MVGVGQLLCQLFVLGYLCLDVRVEVGLGLGFEFGLVLGLGSFDLLCDMDVGVVALFEVVGACLFPRFLQLLHYRFDLGFILLGKIDMISTQYEYQYVYILERPQ